MLVISVPQEHFQMILILLKYLSSNKNIESTNGTYSIDSAILKNYLLKYVVTSIELKNALVKNFSEIFSLIDKAILMFDKEINKIFITKNQICSVIKPLVTKAAISPFDSIQLSQFFNHFECASEKTEFFIDLLTPSSE